MSNKENTGRSKNKVGRPRKSVDWAKVDVLCNMHCPANEIVDALSDLGEDISYDTYDRRAQDAFGISFAEYVNKKKNSLAKPRLRRLQWDAAEAGSVPMLIWLGKIYLDQKDISRQEQTGADGQPLHVQHTSDLTTPQLEAIIKEELKRQKD